MTKGVGKFHNLRLPTFEGEGPEDDDDENDFELENTQAEIHTVDVIGILNDSSTVEALHRRNTEKMDETALPTTPIRSIQNESAVATFDSPNFPSLEVGVDKTTVTNTITTGSTSQDSVDLTYIPISPLTPHTDIPIQKHQVTLPEKVEINKDSHGYRTTSSSSQNLQNLLHKMSSKNSNIMDVAGHSPPIKKRHNSSQRSHNYQDSSDSEDDDDSMQTNPTQNHSRSKRNNRPFNHNYNSLSPISNASYIKQEVYSEFPSMPSPRKKRKDAPVHAQSFVLALAFFAAWSPSNLMAPNLTQMGEYFHFSPEQRDLYLGANIALATGVLSLPLQGILGFMADAVKSRKQLFAYTVMCGGITSIWTGYSMTYTQLFFARFLCGGCMSGSLPIAFSILGDFFDAKDRNAASSGLTAMMGAGILFGQVYAGMVGDISGWQHPFYVSGVLSIITGFMVMYFVTEPVRGGKEAVLQKLLETGSSYDRKLTKDGFIHAMTKNKTNIILMLQGFMTSLPWGIIFVFFNDYLSQEQGLSVSAATFVVLWFGLGSAAGGIAGGLIGSKIINYNRAYLPLFMAFSTAVGVVPFILLLDLKFSKANLLVIFLSFSGGCIANFPSVNVRPCLLNVNPPEARGAAVTAANVIINVARGAGPSLITLSQKFFGVTRQYSFNFCLIVFWSITSLLLSALAKTLPHDQDEMEAELARYAESILETGGRKGVSSDENQDKEPYILVDDITIAGNDTIVSFDDRMTSFDATAAQEGWTFMEDALREIAELSHLRVVSRPRYQVISNDESHEVVLDSVTENETVDHSSLYQHVYSPNSGRGFEEERL
jgi:translation initiation factor 4G